MLFKIMDQMQIQLNKGIKFEFHSCFGQCRFGDDPFGDIETMNGFEEFIQFILIRASDKVKQKGDQDVKGKFSVTSEIFIGLAVASDKVRRNDNIPDEINCVGTYLENQVPCQ